MNYKPPTLPGQASFQPEVDKKTGETSMGLRLPYVALPYQREIGSDPHRFVTVVASRRVGKALALDTPIMTLDGFKNLGDIKIGDIVFDECGLQTKVEYTSEVYYGRTCYKVKFSDGSEIIADASHDWVTETSKYRKGESDKKIKITTEEIRNTLLIKRNDTKKEYNHAISSCKPLQLPTQEQKLDPYILGLWLGDGAERNGEIATADQEILGTVVQKGLTYAKTKDKYSYRVFTNEMWGGKYNFWKRASIKKWLQEMNLIENKHIPFNYLYGDGNQRFELLQGLMDTDGSINDRGRCEFCSTNKKLAEDVFQLILSFGIKATLKESDAKLNGKIISKRYRISFLTTLPVFKLTRKLVKVPITISKPESRRRYIVDVEPYKSVPVKCLGVDSFNHLFLAGKTLIPTHNTIFAINKLLKWALTRDVPNDTAFWYIAPYYHQAKTIAWNLLLKYVPSQLWTRKPNESSLTLYLANGRTIVLKGADSPYSLEGTALGGLVVDEISLMSHWNQLWNYSLRPMLADYQAPAVFISKPRGFNHFHDLAKMGDHRNIIEGEARPGVKLDKDFMTYRFETEINCKDHNGGYIAHEEIETARKTLPPEAFAQEWLGKFTKYTGLVHKDFDRMVHVIPNMELPKEWQRWRGWDFGSNHPTASLRIAIDPDDNWYVERCDKERDVVISKFAEKIREEDALWCSMDGSDTIPGYGDPSGRQWIKEFNKEKLSIRRAVKSENTSEKNWLQLGIDKINEKIKPREKHVVYLPDSGGTKIDNAPSFFILDRPENYKLVSELETLAYKETMDGIDKAEINDTGDREGHYDLDAAFRYIAVSIGKKLSYEKLSQVSESPEHWRNIQSHLSIKPVYTPSAIDLNDAEVRRRYELEADLALVRQQTIN